MKRLTVSAALCLLLVCSCGCNTQNTETEFLLDTVVTVTADCDKETLSGAFDLCRKYDALLSAHNKSSEIYMLNQNGGGKVTKDTAFLLSRAAYCSALTGGDFDITVYPLSVLWNFKNETVPSKDEIAAALESVDYESVKTDGCEIDTSGAKIDLGAIAKGFITDKVLEYLKAGGAKTGIINLGGNVYVFGDKEYNVAIQKPFSQNENSAVIKLKNKTASTSGVYQRYFEKDGNLYHHVIDPKTGYPAKTDLLSVTVICEDSALADALSTACLIKGKQAATEFIENVSGVQAVFVDKDYNLSYTSGIKKSGEYLVLK